MSYPVLTDEYETVLNVPWLCNSSHKGLYEHKDLRLYVSIGMQFRRNKSVLLTRFILYNVGQLPFKSEVLPKHKRRYKQMSNETLIEKVDELIKTIHSEIVTEDNTEDIKSLIGELQHESMIDNILYGDEYSLPTKKLSDIVDERIDMDKLDLEHFLKPVFKFNKDTKMHVEASPIPSVRVMSGYGDDYQVSEYEFFANIYTGDDKEAFKSAISDKDKSIISMEEAKEQLIIIDASGIKKDMTAHMKVVKDAIIENQRATSVYNELMVSVPHVQTLLAQKSKDTTANLKLQHTKFQDVCKNRISVLRTALKHSDVITSTKELEELKTRNLGLKALWNKLQPEHTRTDEE